MAFLCKGRPTPQRPCNNDPSAKPSFMAAIDSVRGFILERDAFGPKSRVGNLASSPSNGMQQRRVRTAERYMAARLAGQTDEVLRLVTEDIELESSRDGKVAGKDRFKGYLTRVKPTGTWKRATWNKAMGKAEILGNVKILMVNVGVIAHFGFNRSGKINRIYVGTRRKAQQP